MGIGYRIKEAREQLRLTQTELGKKVGVTGSAITNYEKETSHPKEQVIYKLMEVLGVDANYLFQDCIHTSKQNDISLSEYEIIKKYRNLDDYGKKMVDFTLQNEWERSTRQPTEGQISLVPVDGYFQIWKNGKWENYLSEKELLKSNLNAAHAGTDKKVTASDQKHDEEIMDDENF